MRKTKRLPVKYKYLLADCGNAGPNPSVSGMKKLFYGVDSFTVMCGNFLYFLARGEAGLTGNRLVAWNLAH